MSLFPENKARPRYDGLGDSWAKMHRDALGPQYYLQDFDGVIGSLGFAQNTQDTIFAEYVPDDYKNRHAVIRRFAYVALFDRKKNVQALHHNSSNLCLSVYLDICRKLAPTQPISPRFFYIIGGDKPPWDIYEVDINTGDIQEICLSLDKESWKDIWSILGLDAMRRKLESWLREYQDGTNAAATFDEPLPF